MHVYDLLGTPTSLHAARWSSFASPTGTRELATVDQRSFMLRLEREF